MAGLLKKAGELGLLGGGVPEEYGGVGHSIAISSTVLSEKASSYASFSVTVGAHSGIGTLPIVYFGTEEQKKKYLPKLATGEWIACVLPFRAAGRLRRPEFPHARRTVARWPALDFERPENVDQQWRLRRHLHRVRQSGWREIFLLHC